MNQDVERDVERDAEESDTNVEQDAEFPQTCSTSVEQFCGSEIDEYGEERSAKDIQMLRAFRCGCNEK